MLLQSHLLLCLCEFGLASFFEGLRTDICSLSYTGQLAFMFQLGTALSVKEYKLSAL